jgi:hypothetical protein
MQGDESMEFEYFRNIQNLNREEFGKNEILKFSMIDLKKAITTSYELYDYIANQIDLGFYNMSKRQYYVFSLSKRVHEMIIDSIDLIETISYQSLNSLLRIILEYTLIATTLAKNKNNVSIRFREWGIINEKKIFLEHYNTLNDTNSLTQQDRKNYIKMQRVFDRFKSKYSLLRYQNKPIYNYDNGWTYFIENINPQIFTSKELYKRYTPNLYFYIQKYHNYVHATSTAIDSDSLVLQKVC